MKTKILLALALFSLTTEASAWVCGVKGGTCRKDTGGGTGYDSSGKVVGRSSTDSQGTTTYYDAGGNIIGRSSKSGDTTTFYDSAGRNVGRATNGTR